MDDVRTVSDQGNDSEVLQRRRHRSKNSTKEGIKKDKRANTLQQEDEEKAEKAEKAEKSKRRDALNGHLVFYYLHPICLEYSVVVGISGFRILWPLILIWAALFIIIIVTACRVSASVVRSTFPELAIIHYVLTY